MLEEAEHRYQTLIEQIPAVTYIDKATMAPTSPSTPAPDRDVARYTPEECWKAACGQSGSTRGQRAHPGGRERFEEEVTSLQ